MRYGTILLGSLGACATNRPNRFSVERFVLLIGSVSARIVEPRKDANVVLSSNEAIRESSGRMGVSPRLSMPSVSMNAVYASAMRRPSVPGEGFDRKKPWTISAVRASVFLKTSYIALVLARSAGISVRERQPPFANASKSAPGWMDLSSPAKSIPLTNGAATALPLIRAIAGAKSIFRKRIQQCPRGGDCHGAFSGSNERGRVSYGKRTPIRQNFVSRSTNNLSKARTTSQCARESV